MTTRLWLVRHGPTNLKTAIGWTDPPADLSETAQIARLDAALPRDCALVSSDLLRARQTADALADGRRRLDPDPGFREINFGSWEGLTFSQIEARDPDLAARYWRQPGEIAPEGGESWDALHSRVDTAMQRILTAHSGGDVIVVAHFGAIIAMLQTACDMTPQSAITFEIDNLSITRIDHFANSGQFRVMGVNWRP